MLIIDNYILCDRCGKLKQDTNSILRNHNRTYYNRPNWITGNPKITRVDICNTCFSNFSNCNGWISESDDKAIDFQLAKNQKIKDVLLAPLMASLKKMMEEKS